MTNNQLEWTEHNGEHIAQGVDRLYKIVHEIYPFRMWLSIWITTPDGLEYLLAGFPSSDLESCKKYAEMDNEYMVKSNKLAYEAGYSKGLEATKLEFKPMFCKKYMDDWLK